MMVNIWLRDIGRQQGGGIPLFTTIFQERVKLAPGQTKMLIVIRGYDYETPFQSLRDDVEASMKKIWDSVHNQFDEDTIPFKDYIAVSVVVLPDKILEQRFETEVGKLRESFATSDLSGYRHDKVAASAFTFSSKEIWETIRQNKRLDLPAHKVMVSKMFCEKVAQEILEALGSHKDYLALEHANTPKEFSERMGTLLNCRLTYYDKETALYDEDTRSAERKNLEDEIIKCILPVCKHLLHTLQQKTSEDSKAIIDEYLTKLEPSDTLMNCDDVISRCVNEFMELCKDVGSVGNDLLSKTCEELRGDLAQHAKFKASSIREKHMREEAERAKQRADEKAAEMEAKAEQARQEARRAQEEMQRQREEAEREAARIKEEAQLEIQRKKEAAEKEMERIKNESEKTMQEMKRMQDEFAQSRPPPTNILQDVVHSVPIWGPLIKLFGIF